MAHRKVLVALAALSIALPAWHGMAQTTRAGVASCTDVWTGTQTAISSWVPYGVYSYRGTAYYQLKYNTCNLGVYTQIVVTEFISQYSVSGDVSGYTYESYPGKILANCNEQTDGCTINPGPTVWTDTRHFPHAGNGPVTRVAYPPYTPFAYSTHAAIFDYFHIIDGMGQQWIFQFLRGQVIHGGG